MKENAGRSIAGLPVHVGVRLVAMSHLDEADAARERVARDRDSEALHDFRVALRRLRSWVRTFRQYLDGAVAKADRRRLREVARATSSARDTEVQLEWLDRLEATGSAEEAKRRVRHALAGLQKPAEREAIRAVHRFPDASDRLRQHLPVYIGRVDRASPARIETMAAAASNQASTMRAELRAQLDAIRSSADAKEIHDARIAGKRLRYLFEAFRDDANQVASAIRELRRMQDAFGDHHDLDVLAATIRSITDDGAAEGNDALSQLADHAVAARDATFEERVVPFLENPDGSLFATIDSAIGELSVFEAGSNLEIERKFLLRGVPRRKGRTVHRIDQGWLPGEKVVERVRRIRSDDGTRWLRTIKIGHGLARVELEEEIDHELFRKLWRLTRGRRVSKRRYVWADGERVWEIDRFSGRDLVIAETEMRDPQEIVNLPAWLGRYVIREVTGDRRYENVNLAE
jgi:CHAD domain-containing protein/CYTH domain-containing protein